MKQIPCYQPTTVVEEAKTINTPLRAEDGSEPTPTVLTMSAPTVEKTIDCMPVVVDSDAGRAGLMQLASLVT